MGKLLIIVASQLLMSLINVEQLYQQSSVDVKSVRPCYSFMKKALSLTLYALCFLCILLIAYK